MPSLDTYRKQAKQLVRWHRERNYSIGGKLRLLERYRHLTDIDILDMPLPLTLAQEVVAAEAGFQSWTALKSSTGSAAPATTNATRGEQTLAAAIPVLFVRDVATAAAFYEERLGFDIEFLHGKPPFYGSVARDQARLHLRFVHAPNFTELESREGALILATITVADVKALFAEFEARGVSFAQRLTQQAWGGLDFDVRDPDGNVISFVQHRRPTRPAGGDDT